MEKNTILAVVLSMIVLIAAFVIQGFNMTKQQMRAQQQTASTSQINAVDTEPRDDPQQAEEFSSTEQAVQTAQMTSISAGEDKLSSPMLQAAGEQEMSQIPHQYITIDSELFTAILTNIGGEMVSFVWKDTKNDAHVDLILAGDNEARAFAMSFGEYDVNSFFHVNRISDYSVEFYRDFSVPGTVYGMDGKFTLIKRYDFIPHEYMFRLTIILDGGYSVNGFNFGQYRTSDGKAISDTAYTLSFGPQIGPRFVKLDNLYDYRHYNIFVKGKRRNAKVNDIIDNRPDWAAISGKYFAFIARPLLAQYSLNYSEKAESGLISASRLNIIRPAAGVSKVEDIYHFYLGPKKQETLNIYNTGKNEFNIRESNLNEAASSRGFWGVLAPLERLLKWLLLGFYNIIPNYGVAIILLTLLIKILFFPLTKKGSEATLRMQALAPKIKEIQEKYKGNPQKLNAEMGNFYKQEGYNPLSGCLPMLLQLPIFIAMYNLFNNHFDLRGAGFIPGWIPDLSLPEHIVQFGDFRVPIVGWTALRALPFIYVGSQLLYGKVTQMPGQQSNTQMKMMLYVMPIVFFFILYDVPSGLLIYWICSNLLTLVQQLIINKYVLKKKAAAGAAANAEAAKSSFVKPPTERKIAPGGGKKKKRK
jgi:YidC/Oxa1 family membrane protein insertase